MKLRMTRFLILLTALMILPASAYAESCTKPASVMLLQGKDEKRLELARSLKAYLRSKTQDEGLATAIYKASLKTGVDFELMVLKAKMESDLGRLTFARHTTARGAFQYIEPTWLTLIRRYGKDIGYEHYGDAIARSKYPGVPYIKNGNPFLKAEILALRHDPDISALIKAYQVREETDVIRSYKRGKRVTATDHYIVHMLGLPLAKEFYTMKRRGSIIAVAGLNNAAMREAARMNRAFFYSGKRALTAREAYAKFEKRVNKEFKTIQNVAYKNKTPACAQSDEPTLELAKLDSIMPLCSGYQAIPQPQSALHGALHPLHPCARARTH